MLSVDNFVSNIMVMKKLIVALDGLDFSESAAKYAAFLASSTKTYLTGVFLDDVTYHGYRIYHLLDDDGVSESKLKELNEKDDQVRKKSVIKFKKICDQAKIKYKIRHDRNMALEELISESIYADLLVMDRTNTFRQREEKAFGSFLKNALNNVECPAVIAPPAFKDFQNLIFLYDGSPASVYAIKMFSYLLSDFRTLPIEIVSVKQSSNYPNLSVKYLMNDWIKRYFTTISYTVLRGDPERTIAQYAKPKKNNSLFILGARKRGAFSYWFRESMAELLIQKVQAPLFIVRY